MACMPVMVPAQACSFMGEGWEEESKNREEGPVPSSKKGREDEERQRRERRKCLLKASKDATDVTFHVRMESIRQCSVSAWVMSAHHAAVILEEGKGREADGMHGMVHGHVCILKNFYMDT